MTAEPLRILPEPTPPPPPHWPPTKAERKRAIATLAIAGLYYVLGREHGRMAERALTARRAAGELARMRVELAYRAQHDADARRYANPDIPIVILMKD